MDVLYHFCDIFCSDSETCLSEKYAFDGFLTRSFLYKLIHSPMAEIWNVQDRQTGR